MTLYESGDAFNKTLGVVRLEVWREGIVLWVGGEIRWQSWSDSPVVTSVTATQNFPQQMAGKINGY